MHHLGFVWYFTKSKTVCHCLDLSLIHTWFLVSWVIWSHVDSSKYLGSHLALEHADQRVHLRYGKIIFLLWDCKRKNSLVIKLNKSPGHCLRRYGNSANLHTSALMHLLAKQMQMTHNLLILKHFVYVKVLPANAFVVLVILLHHHSDLLVLKSCFQVSACTWYKHLLIIWKMFILFRCKIVALGEKVKANFTQG